MQYKIVLAAVLPLVALSAHAQQALPNAADAGAAVPAVHYESVFKSYQPFRESEIAKWRELNEEVSRAGGHVGILGGAGHADHGRGKPPTSSSAEGQPPARSAPKASGTAHH